MSSSHSSPYSKLNNDQTSLITPSAPPPGYNTVMDSSKSTKINTLIEKYEIAYLFSEKLSMLEKYEIVLLIDDSGSMNTPLNDHTAHATRWDELKSVINIVISVATIFDEDGIDIHFLNRSNHSNVKSLDEVDTILHDKPHGLTPLVSKLEEILTKFKDSEKPVLVVIPTDGVPNSGNGQDDLKEFKQLLQNKNHSKFFISFLACSDQDSEIGYLNDLDKAVPNIDTLDDYCSERKEVVTVQGADFSYTFGDHVARLLLGPICPELDNLDERKFKKKRTTRCTIL